MPVRSKVAMLPAEVRVELERRIVARAFSGYQDLAEWLQAQGYHIAHDSVQRYGSRLQQKIEAMEWLAEEAKALTTAGAQAGGTLIDATIMVIHQRVFSMLLEQPERGEEASSATVPAGAPQSDEGALVIRDLVRLTRIVADLNRVTIARQRQAEAVKSRLEQNKHAARVRSAETEGGLSEEAYHTIRNALLGINPFAPDSEHREESSSAGVPASAHHLEGRGGERNEKSPTDLDADRRTSTPRTCSNAPFMEATPSEKARLRASDPAQVQCTSAEPGSLTAPGGSPVWELWRTKLPGHARARACAPQTARDPSTSVGMTETAVDSITLTHARGIGFSPARVGLRPIRNPTRAGMVKKRTAHEELLEQAESLLPLATIASAITSQRCG